MNLDNKFVRLSIEKSLRDLPALPGIVARVLKETENQDVSAHSVEKLLSSDQALASKVLRVVNSAYYGLSGQITSLSQAIMILGMPQVRNLVLSVSAISTLKPKTPRQHETLKLFWLHAFGTAAATQLIAQQKRMKVNDMETLFLGGLLHDIGRLFLYCMFTQTYDQVLKYAEDKQITSTSAEDKLLGLNHSQIGYTMASTWKLPPSLTDLIAKHEGPFEPDDDPTLFAVHIGDVMTQYLYYSTENIVQVTLDPVAEEWLGLGEEELAELKEQTEQKVEEASALFGLLAA
ncbi:MAG TPA: HDOD domain-containing protein [Fimbriimonadaceae bacterium]|nr:HDOD domain-containing protein [Fimbriimonadaceae bacterium]